VVLAAVGVDSAAAAVVDVAAMRAEALAATVIILARSY